MVFWVILQYNFPTLPIAPAETMRPLCVPALLVLVRGRSGLAAVAVLCTWRAGPAFWWIWFGIFLFKVIKFK